VLAPDFISKCVEILDQNSEVAVCFPRAKLIDQNGAFLEDYNIHSDTNSPKATERFRNLILNPRRPVQAMGLMRSAIIKETMLHGRYPSSDEVFMAEMALRGHFKEIPDRLLMLRVHPAQSTQGVLASRRKRILFFDTSAQGKTVLITWLYFAGCLKAIGNAPLNTNERLSCYLTMLRWVFIWKNFKSINKDMLLALREALRALFKWAVKPSYAIQKTERT
jgi:hypothetical protein